MKIKQENDQENGSILISEKLVLEENFRKEVSFNNDKIISLSR